MVNWKKTVHWLLAILLVVYVVTGFGITEFRYITPLTLGIFDKPTSMKIHNGLEIPFAIVLLAHLYLTFMKREEDQ